jgi:Domain of unknown function (DUF4262)
MFTTLDVDPSKLDEHEQKFISNIREHGWFGTAVFGDEEGPGFSYTTGFWLKFSFPGVITFSLKRELAHDTFWHIYRTLHHGDFGNAAGRQHIREQPHRAVAGVETALQGSPRLERLCLLRRRFRLRATGLDGSRWRLSVATRLCN